MLVSYFPFFFFPVAYAYADMPWCVSKTGYVREECTNMLNTTSTTG